MEKTLVGKDGWLFLKNDSCRELEVHCNNLYLVNDSLLKDRYTSFKHKFFMTIFPNKSLVYSDYLPSNYIVKYRPGFDTYKRVLGDCLLDGYEVLKGLPDTYYKTDTHINFRGAYLVYCDWIRHVNQRFSLCLPVPNHTVVGTEVQSLSELNVGIGDLTWDSNRGSIVIERMSDLYFRSDTVEFPYMTYTITRDGPIRLLLPTLEDVTNTRIGATLDWAIVSACILFKRNTGAVSKRAVIFYDSFLLSTMSLYMNLFNETYMVKNIYDPSLVKKINPDFVFEFRVERFLF